VLLFVLLTWLFVGLCVYVYVGYPLLLALLAKFRANPPQQGDITPPVSLIIAAYNEEVVIAEKVENSLKLNYPAEKLQIMVVADGSNDSTPQIVEKYPDEQVVLLFSPERRGKSAALNRGVEQATGEILVFSDANAFYHADAIRHLVRNFNDPAVGCVSGRKTIVSSASSIGESEGLYWKYESFIKKAESRVHSSTGVVGEMNAIRREFFEAIPENIINDDAYLAFRVMQKGYRVLYESEAYSWETSALSTRDEVIRRQRINAGRYQLFFSPRELWPWNNRLVLFKLISHKFFRLLLPFFMFGAFLFNAAVLLFPDAPLIMSAVFLLQLMFYFLAFTGRLAEQSGRKFRLVKLAYYIVSSNEASVRGLIRYLRGKQSVLWEKASRA
jgi:cellulose synthase/poly-beta-1,6-N-acetylglucosamine synthase-like glycosyltransferase